MSVIAALGREAGGSLIQASSVIYNEFKVNLNCHESFSQQQKARKSCAYVYNAIVQTA